MLDVVQDEQELTVAYCPSERVERRLAGRLRDADRGRERRQEQPGVAQRRELDDRGAVGEARRSLSSGREREARLAAASCAGEDDQSHFAAREERGQRLELALTSDERGGRHGERARGVHGRRAQVERRILLEDAALKLAKLCARLQSELVVQPPPKSV